MSCKEKHFMLTFSDYRKSGFRPRPGGCDPRVEVSGLADGFERHVTPVAHAYYQCGVVDEEDGVVTGNGECSTSNDTALLLPFNPSRLMETVAASEHGYYDKDRMVAQGLKERHDGDPGRFYAPLHLYSSGADWWRRISCITIVLVSVIALAIVVYYIYYYQWHS
jgi:hypothetical protein